MNADSEDVGWLFYGVDNIDKIEPAMASAVYNI